MAGAGTSLFASIAEAPADPILGITAAFKADRDPRKINLGVGAYRTGEGATYILPVVKRAEAELLKDIEADRADKEYAPIDGPPGLKPLTQRLIFGKGAKAMTNDAIASVQALSGTGALRVVGEFIKTFLPKTTTIYVSDPTWANHPTIFQKSGLSVQKYPYWDDETKKLNYAGMVACLREAPQGSAVLLHSCAHNPTGTDPSKEQWTGILNVVRERGLVAIMDSAYQGYASGSLEEDAYAIRLFEQAGLEFFVCQSFAKNLGLYGERMGMVHVVCESDDRARVVLSQLKMVIRPMYSSPPIHGAQLILKVLGQPELYSQWEAELSEMAQRILQVRSGLREGLEKKGTPGTWNHITDQIGMFSYTGLTVPQCECLTDKHHVYLVKSGRISMAGLNTGNLAYMVDAVDDAVRTLSPQSFGASMVKPAYTVQAVDDAIQAA